MKPITFIAAGLATCAALHSISANAGTYDDRKAWSGSMCAPYTSTTPDYGTLKFRATGVTNESTGYLYVICALPLDDENGWDGTTVDNYGIAQIYFRANTTGTDQCTMTIGTTAAGTTYTRTESVDGVVGATVYLSMDTPLHGVFSAAQPMTVVCRIAPRHTLSLIQYKEINGQTDGYQYVP